MTDRERAIMHAHADYWVPYVETGTMIVMGPVADPSGGWGLGVIAVENEERLQELLKGDPASVLGYYEILPMIFATYKQ